jgi:hypothetical protein
MHIPSHVADMHTFCSSFVSTVYAPQETAGHLCLLYKENVRYGTVH